MKVKRASPRTHIREAHERKFKRTFIHVRRTMVSFSDEGVGRYLWFRTRIARRRKRK